PAVPAGRLAASLASSSLARSMKGAAVTCLGATAPPEVKTWPVAVASSKETTLPVKTWPGKNLKVTSTSWPGSIARIDLLGLDADDRFRRTDECHHRRERQGCHPPPPPP